MELTEKTALIELTDTELYEVAGGCKHNISGDSFSIVINNQDSNQGVQLFGFLDFGFLDGARWLLVIGNLPHF